MKTALRVVSFVALTMLVVAPVGVYLGKMDLTTCKHWMFTATVLWFATAPFWMRRKA